MVVFAAGQLGGPVSTTHVVTTSVMGVGAGEHPRRVWWGRAGEIGLTWLTTLPRVGGSRGGDLWIRWLDREDLMEGFGRWKAFLGRAFPKSADFAVLLAGLATRVRDSIQECRTQILAEKPDLDRTGTTFEEVRKTGKAVTDALNESFATSFDREDILRAVEELIWVAEYADHAVR